MFLLRVIGGWVLLAAIIALVDDVTYSYETGAKLAFASLGTDWDMVSSASRAAFETGIERHVTPLLWDPVILTVLKAPAFAALGVIGVLLYLAGLRRRRLNIYAN